MTNKEVLAKLTLEIKRVDRLRCDAELAEISQSNDLTPITLAYWTGRLESLTFLKDELISEMEEDTNV